MGDSLSKDCVVFLDDAWRAAEQDVAQRWIETWGGHLVLEGSQKPYYRIDPWPAT